MLDQPITIKGKTKQWTLGNYLLLMKKGASSVKMGVAYTAPLLSDSSSFSDDDRTNLVSDFQPSLCCEWPICYMYVQSILYIT